MHTQKHTDLYKHVHIYTYTHEDTQTHLTPSYKEREEETETDREMEIPETGTERDSETNGIQCLGLASQQNSAAPV